MKTTVMVPVAVGMEIDWVSMTAQRGGRGRGVSVLGLSKTQAQEMKIRLTSALQESKVIDADVEIAVNNFPKQSSYGPSVLDFAAGAVALSALGLFDLSDGSLFYGSLSLAGRIRPESGVTPAVLAALESEYEYVYVSEANAAEASFAAQGSMTVLEAQSLMDLMTGQYTMVRDVVFKPQSGPRVDVADRRVESTIQQAIEAGNSMLFVGGARRQQFSLARSVASLMGPMDFDEALAVTYVHSIAGLVPEHPGYVGLRPLRMPHHTVSAAGLVGQMRPGEVSLANHGVLVLDEVNEFRRATLRELRRALESGEASGFPADDVILAGTITADAAVRAWERSPDLFDLFDIIISADPEVDVAEVMPPGAGERLA